MTLNKSKVRLCMPLTKGRKAILNVAGSVGERPQDEGEETPKKGHEERMALAKMAMCRRGKGK